jgi:hypothetical protein
MLHRSLVLVVVALAGCFPKRDLPPDEIQKLDALAKVMDVQATIADPQFGKIGNASYTDADWGAFADVGSRLQVTSQKTKQFSKGPEFDGLADQLHTKAEALTTAATSKDAKAASDSLSQIKATCKTCHSKFR